MSWQELVFIRHPTLLGCGISSVLALAALTPRPTLLPLVFVLSTLQLYARIVYKRPGRAMKVFATWASLTVAISLGHLGPALTALSSASNSIFLLLLISGTTSALSLTTVFADVLLCSRMRRAWSHVTIFPALWASLWGAVSHLSPVGRLATWSPVVSLGPYEWVRGVFGQWGIDWVTAAWSIALAQMIGDWAVGAGERPTEVIEEDGPQVGDQNGIGGDGTLIDHELPENGSLLYHGRTSTSNSIPSSKSRRALVFMAFLLALMLPSYLAPELPLPLNSPDTTPLTVACVLPKSRDLKNGPGLLEDFIKESKRLNAAKIHVWPEGAVRFDTYDAKQRAIEEVKNAIPGLNHYIGVSFEEVIPPPSPDGRIKRRNGFVLVGRHGPVMEYYKRNLVPVAESFSLEASMDPPPLWPLELTAPPGVKKGDWASAPNYTRPIPLTTSICLDFSTPSSFTSLPSRPALILAPARTWDTSVGLAMWEQAKARAAETGSTVLWCDGGEGGVSGVAGRGMNDVQVGEGTWTRTIAVGWPFDDKLTPYIAYGEKLVVATIWGLVVLELVGAEGAAAATGLISQAWRVARAGRRMRPSRNAEHQPLLG